MVRIVITPTWARLIDFDDGDHAALRTCRPRMEPLTRQTLHGTWGPVLLPVGDDESVDLGRLDEQLAVLSDAGLDGVYTSGSAGELHTLDEQEHDAISTLVAERCGQRGVPFQLGASQMSGQLSLARIRRSRDLAPAAFQVILPDWLPLAPDEVLAAVERLAEAADPVPLVLYNPPHAKTRLEPEAFGLLATAVPALVGIKIAGEDPAVVAAIHAAAPTLAIFVAGHALATGRRHGACGSYSNVACLSPRGAVAWQRSMTEDPDGGTALEARIQAFLAEHVGPFQRAGYANPALDKLLAMAGGWAPVGTRTRWPYRFIAEEEARRLAPIARRALPELFPA